MYLNEIGPGLDLRKKMIEAFNGYKNLLDIFMFIIFDL